MFFYFLIFFFQIILVSTEFMFYWQGALSSPHCFLPPVHFIKAAFPCRVYLGDVSGKLFLLKIIEGKYVGYIRKDLVVSEET